VSVANAKWKCGLKHGNSFASFKKHVDLRPIRGFTQASFELLSLRQSSSPSLFSLFGNFQIQVQVHISQILRWHTLCYEWGGPMVTNHFLVSYVSLNGRPMNFVAVF